jgi:hypothetical protein
MIYQIALCATLLILAITGSPNVQAGSDQSGSKQQAVEARQQTPRMLEADKPKFMDVGVSDASLNEIAKWLSQNLELPLSDELPRVEFVSQARLRQLRYKDLLPQQSQVIGGEHATPRPQSQREVVAVYDDSTRTIYLPAGWTGGTADRSVLVHEMVHHLQNLAGLRFDCSGAREKPAYLAQNRWLKLHGLDLETEFEVDMFTIVALSACMN